MNGGASGWLRRAHTTLHAARVLLDVEPEGAASRAYYAAFYAVSAVFAARGESFRKHAQARAAVHRDLVHAGLWTPAVGELYDRRPALRDRGDYALSGVTREAASQAVEDAAMIVAAAAALLPAEA